MLKRSKSVPKISDIELLRRVPGAVKTLHEKVSSRVYGDKSLAFFRNVRAFPFVDKPPLMHLHKQKSFELVMQSEPSVRMRKLKDARMFNKPSPDSVRLRLKRSASIHNTTAQSTHRLDKSTEIINQAQNLLIKEQENTETVMKKAQGFCGKVALSLKNINRKLSLAGIPSIGLSNKLSQKKGRLRILSTKNN